MTLPTLCKLRRLCSLGSPCSPRRLCRTGRPGRAQRLHALAAMSSPLRLESPSPLKGLGRSNALGDYAYYRVYRKQRARSVLACPYHPGLPRGPRSDLAANLSGPLSDARTCAAELGEREAVA